MKSLNINKIEMRVLKICFFIIVCIILYYIMVIFFVEKKNEMYLYFK